MDNQKTLEVCQALEGFLSNEATHRNQAEHILKLVRSSELMIRLPINQDICLPYLMFPLMWK